MGPPKQAEQGAADTLQGCGTQDGGNGNGEIDYMDTGYADYNAIHGPPPDINTTDRAQRRSLKAARRAEKSQRKEDKRRRLDTIKGDAVLELISDDDEDFQAALKASTLYAAKRTRSPPAHRLENMASSGGASGSALGGHASKRMKHSEPAAWPQVSRSSCAALPCETTETLLLGPRGSRGPAATGVCLGAKVSEALMGP
jgi:hypothetical protein